MGATWARLEDIKEGLVMIIWPVPLQLPCIDWITKCMIVVHRHLSCCHNKISPNAEQSESQRTA